MRLLLPAVFTLATAGLLAAQYPGLTLPPSGNNQKASVTQFIGPVKISIAYSSPAVHGPDGKDRRGQIWGKLVPYGMADLGFGNGKPSPWRGGANENTVFEVSNDVVIQGKTLPAGRYGLHMIPSADEWTVIFSKDSSSWGSFFYEESHDALRVTAKPAKHEYREWLTYEFTERRPKQATVELQWEDLALPMTIQADVNPIYISKLTAELTNVPGFGYQGFDAAAQFCLQENTNLDLGLTWSEKAIAAPFVGQANFDTLSVKAQILDKMGRADEAKTVMQTALHHPTANALQIHQYGRQLLAAKKTTEALEVFQYNAERNGDAWPVHVGLARGYAATGDNQKALEHARKALPQAPDELNRKGITAMIAALSAGQPINQ